MDIKIKHCYLIKLNERINTKKSNIKKYTVWTLELIEHTVIQKKLT